jgi:MFS family permease
MLLGGRLADLLGRRRVLVAGTVLFATASLTGGLAESAGVLVAARLVQGLGAAVLMPAALSLLTTSFSSGSDRPKALGVWGGIAGLASALGVFLVACSPKARAGAGCWRSTRPSRHCSCSASSV